MQHGIGDHHIFSARLPGLTAMVGHHRGPLLDRLEWVPLDRDPIRD